MRIHDGNKRNGTLYVGVTSNISRRAYEHRIGAVDGFTKRYGCKMLVWFESYGRMVDAIARQKQIKSGSRATKLALIEALNPDWCDLSELERLSSAAVIASEARRSSGSASTVGPGRA